MPHSRARVKSETVRCEQCRCQIHAHEDQIVICKQSGAVHCAWGEIDTPSTPDLVLAYLCPKCSPVVLQTVAATKRNPNRLTIGIASNAMLLQALAGLRLLDTAGVRHIEVDRVDEKAFSFVTMGDEQRAYTYQLATGQLVPAP